MYKNMVCHILETLICGTSVHQYIALKINCWYARLYMTFQGLWEQGLRKSMPIGLFGDSPSNFYAGCRALKPSPQHIQWFYLAENFTRGICHALHAWHLYTKNIHACTTSNEKNHSNWYHLDLWFPSLLGWNRYMLKYFACMRGYSSLSVTKAIDMFDL